jgi:hypothetical protein
MAIPLARHGKQLFAALGPNIGPKNDTDIAD